MPAEPSSLGWVLSELGVSISVDETGAANVRMDPRLRRGISEREFFVDRRFDGDGSRVAPFGDLPDVFALMSARQYPDAVIHVAPGDYSWGDAIDPRSDVEPFDADLTVLGSGSGRTRVLQGEHDSAAAVFREQGRSLYVEGIDFVGRGIPGGVSNEHVLDVRNGRALTLVDVIVRDATAGDGLLAINFETVVLERTVAQGNAQDGLSYASPGDGQAPMYVLEADVLAVDNGLNGNAASQGSATHRATQIVRVGGRYERNPTNIEDTGLVSWNIDLKVADSTVFQPHEGGPVNLRVRGDKKEGTHSTAHLISGSYDAGGVVHAHETSSNGVPVYGFLRYSPLVGMVGTLPDAFSGDLDSHVAPAREGSYVDVLSYVDGHSGSSGTDDGPVAPDGRSSP